MNWEKKFQQIPVVLDQLVYIGGAGIDRSGVSQCLESMLWGMSEDTFLKLFPAFRNTEYYNSLEYQWANVIEICKFFRDRDIRGFLVEYSLTDDSFPEGHSKYGYVYGMTFDDAMAAMFNRVQH